MLGKWMKNRKNARIFYVFQLEVLVKSKNIGYNE